MALAIDPATPTTLYAGTQCSGVLKSLDGGDSWSAVNTGLTNQYVYSLAIEPTTLYAGTNRGAFRSLNGGRSWAAAGLANAQAWVLAIDPDTPIPFVPGRTTPMP